MFISLCYMYIFFFFFKQKTAYELRISDWSSDVCSSDLARPREIAQQHVGEQSSVDIAAAQDDADGLALEALGVREQRREPRRARALDHGLFDLEQQAHRFFEAALTDQHDIVDQRLDQARKSVVWGKSVSVRVDLGGRRLLKKKKNE